jgi:predicted Zn-dependent protease with MMP-like domain
MIQVSDEQFDQAVSEALDSAPPEFRPYMDDVVVDVQDFPDRQVLQRLGIRNRQSLLGYYHGIPLTRRSVSQTVQLPDYIVIYKKNIQRICNNREELVEQIRRTVLHEVGHHFGMSENDLRRLNY